MYLFVAIHKRLERIHHLFLLFSDYGWIQQEGGLLQDRRRASAQTKLSVWPAPQVSECKFCVVSQCLRYCFGVRSKRIATGIRTLEASPQPQLPRASVRDIVPVWPQQRTGSAGMGIEATVRRTRQGWRCEVYTWEPQAEKIKVLFCIGPGSQLLNWFEMKDDLGIG